MYEHAIFENNSNLNYLIMSKNATTKLMSFLFIGCILLISCSDDDESPNAPSISLSQTTIDVQAEQSNSVTVNYASFATSHTITVTKYLDGVMDGASENIPSSTGNGSFTYEFSVTVDDSDSGIIKYNFTITDNIGQVSQTELVVNIELTKRQLLLKYDWLLTDEIRVKTGASDIDPNTADDVYRFNEDGSYQRSFGALVVETWDDWYNHCQWDLNEETGVLKLYRIGAFGTNVYDVMTITLINKEEINADIVYLGLDVFDPSYDTEEDYIKKFAAQAKGGSFDPYRAGSDDDATGAYGTACGEADFVNN